jgi:hypothetical protein
MPLMGYLKSIMLPLAMSLATSIEYTLDELPKVSHTTLAMLLANYL